MSNWVKKSLKALVTSGLGSKLSVKSETPKNTPTAKEIFALLSSNIEAELQKEKCVALLNSIKSVLDLSVQHQNAIQKSLTEQFSTLTKKEELLTLIENYRVVSKTGASTAIAGGSEPKKWLATILQSHPMLEEAKTNIPNDVHANFKIKGTETPKINYTNATSYLKHTPYRPKTLDTLDYFKGVTPLVSTASLKKIKPLTKDLDTSAAENHEIIPNPQKIIDVLVKQDNLYDLNKEVKKLLHLPRISTLGAENHIFKFLVEMDCNLEQAILAYTHPQEFISDNHRQITSLIDIAISYMPNRPVPKELADFINSYPKAPDEHLSTRKTASLSLDEKVFLKRRIEALKHAHQQIKSVIKAFGLDAHGYKIAEVCENGWATRKSFNIDDVRLPYISTKTQDLMHFVLFDWQKDVFHANSETIDGAKLKQLLIYFGDCTDKFPEHLSLLQSILKDKLSKITMIDEQPYHPINRGNKINHPFVNETGNFSSKKLKEFLQNLYECEVPAVIELWSLSASPKEKPYFEAWHKQKPLLKKIKEGDKNAFDKMTIGQPYIFPIYTKMSTNVQNRNENNLEHYNQIIAIKTDDGNVDMTYINPLANKNYIMTITNALFKMLVVNMVHADTANPSPEVDFLKNQESFFKKLQELIGSKPKIKELEATKQVVLLSSAHSIRRGIEVVIQ